jgi:hypothetical protein
VAPYGLVRRDLEYHHLRLLAFDEFLYDGEFYTWWAIYNGRKLPIYLSAI